MNILFPQLFNLLYCLTGKLTLFRLTVHVTYETRMIFTRFIFTRMLDTNILSVTRFRYITEEINYRKSVARDDSDERGEILLVSDRVLGFRTSLSLRLPAKQCKHIQQHAYDMFRIIERELQNGVNTHLGLVLPNIQLYLYETIRVFALDIYLYVAIN